MWTKLLNIVIAIFLLFVAYVMLIYMPIHVYTEISCIKQGFPDHKVTINLERYCITIEGATTAKVVKQ